jgi:hypothetical protein
MLWPNVQRRETHQMRNIIPDLPGIIEAKSVTFPGVSRISAQEWPASPPSDSRVDAKQRITIQGALRSS